MKRLILALALLAAPTLASAQAFLPGRPITDTNPQPVKMLCWGGTAFVPCAAGGGGGGGDASAANQTSVQANAGSSASKALSVQGIAGGVALPVSGTVAANINGTVPVSGTVGISGTVPVSGSVTSTISGTVATSIAGTVPVGGIFNSTLPTYTTGSSTALQTTTRGELLATITSGGTQIASAGNASDNVASNGTANNLRVLSYGMCWDGATWDRCKFTSDNVATGQVSVGTTATQVVAQRLGRMKVTFTVTAANSCAVGGPSVTLTTGYPLQPIAGASLPLSTGAALSMICNATTPVGFIEEY